MNRKQQRDALARAIYEGRAKPEAWKETGAADADRVKSLTSDYGMTGAAFDATPSGSEWTEDLYHGVEHQWFSTEQREAAKEVAEEAAKSR